MLICKYGRKHHVLTTTETQLVRNVSSLRDERTRMCIRASRTERALSIRKARLYKRTFIMYGLKRPTYNERVCERLPLRSLEHQLACTGLRYVRSCQRHIPSVRLSRTNKRASRTDVRSVPNVRSNEHPPNRSRGCA